jgi:hypothetical protein
MKVTETIPIFYSSTYDDATFNRRASFRSVCERVGIANGVSLHVLDSKKNIPGGVGKTTGQDVLDKAVGGAYDIYFGCLGVRFGEGTTSEFRTAIEGHINRNDPKEVLFCFDECPINPFEVGSNFSKVKTFRKSLESATKHGRAILYFTFCSQEEFEEKVFLNIDNSVKKVLSRVQGGVVIAGKH